MQNFGETKKSVMVNKFENDLLYSLSSFICFIFVEIFLGFLSRNIKCGTELPNIVSSI